MRCCFESGKKKPESKPLTELYVKGQFIKNTQEWQEELQRHCEEVCADLEERKEMEKYRI